MTSGGPAPRTARRRAGVAAIVAGTTALLVLVLALITRPDRCVTINGVTPGGTPSAVATYCIHWVWWQGRYELPPEGPADSAVRNLPPPDIQAPPLIAAAGASFAVSYAALGLRDRRRRDRPGA